MNVKLKIEKIFNEDQADRSPKFLSNLNDAEKWQIIEARDRVRIKTLDNILRRNPKLDGEDYFRAGIVMQHGGRVSFIKRANSLARKSMKLGNDRGKWLYAASIDRMLMMQGKKQKFGTQFRKTLRGNWIIHPMIKKTKDTERKEYGVKTLKEIKETLKGLNRSKINISKKIALSYKGK